MSKVVVVDFSNLANTCWYPALNAEENGKKALEEWNAGGYREPDAVEPPKQYDAKLVLHTNLSLKLDTLKQALGVDPNWYVFVEDDHDEVKYRLFPGYKANRDRNKFDPRPLAKGYLRNSLTPSARWVRSPGHEADDAIATLACQYAAEGNDAIVVSGDKDLWQLLQHPGIRIYSPAHKGFITPIHIAKAFNGLTNPKLIALHKALWGDSGDNVPNAVPRMQKPLIPVMDASDGTLSDFLEKTDQHGLSDRCVHLLQENLRQVVINDNLVRLKLDLPLEWQ